jgi:hypothetical protein
MFSGCWLIISIKGVVFVCSRSSNMGAVWNEVVVSHNQLLITEAILSSCSSALEELSWLWILQVGRGVVLWCGD